MRNKRNVSPVFDDRAVKRRRESERAPIFTGVHQLADAVPWHFEANLRLSRAIRGTCFASCCTRYPMQGTYAQSLNNNTIASVKSERKDGTEPGVHCSWKIPIEDCTNNSLAIRFSTDIFQRHRNLFIRLGMLKVHSAIETRLLP